MNKKKRNVYEEIIQWLETHDGRYPRRSIIRNEKRLKIEEMSLEEKEETRLCGRWYCSKEYKAYKACKRIALENLPTEYAQYREQIATLRRYEQIRKGMFKESKTYKEMIQWLETHNGTKPRFHIKRDGKRLNSEEMSLEEKAERSLAARWYDSQEYKVYRTCEGISLESLPTEYEQYREQIATLRGYEKKNIYEEMIQWLEAHNGTKPRSAIIVNEEKLKVEFMSLEEKEERSLAKRWQYSQEYKAYKACEGIPLESLPTEYEQYREQIATLRRYEKKNIYKEMLQWLERNNYRKPRSAIVKKGQYLKVEEMSLEEKEERNLCARWYRSQEYKAYKACEGIPLESLPTKYEQYREQIATLRRYKQIRREKAVEKRMRRSIAKQVQNNASTRSELSGVVKQLKEDTLEIS